MKQVQSRVKIPLCGVKRVHHVLLRDRVELLRVGTVVVVEDQVGVDLQLLVVRGLDQRPQLFFRAEPGPYSSFRIFLTAFCGYFPRS